MHKAHTIYSVIRWLIFKCTVQRPLQGRTYIIMGSMISRWPLTSAPLESALVLEGPFPEVMPL